MAKGAVQISNGPESGMLLMRFTLELPNRVLQHFILSQSIRDSLEFMKLFPIAQSQNIPLIEFLTLPITVSGEGDGSTTEATENELNTVRSFMDHNYENDTKNARLVPEPAENLI